MGNQNIALESDLTHIFPDIVTRDERANYRRLPGKSLSIYLPHMQRLRDDLGI